MSYQRRVYHVDNDDERRNELLEAIHNRLA